MAVLALAICSSAQATGLYIDDLGDVDNQGLLHFSPSSAGLATGLPGEGVWGALGAREGTIVTFTILGGESSYSTPLFAPDAGGFYSGLVGETSTVVAAADGLLDFSFLTGGKKPKVFSNGQQQSGTFGFVLAPGSNGFDYYIGLNQGLKGSAATYDDVVVGVAGVASAPLPATALLFGSAVLLGTIALRRREAVCIS